MRACGHTLRTHANPIIVRVFSRLRVHLTFATVGSQDASTATIVIGHHRLHGKRVALPKPVAVLRRSGGSGDDAERDADGDVAFEDAGDAPDDGKDRHLSIVGVIRSKYIFDKRPQLLISSVAKPKPR